MGKERCSPLMGCLGCLSVIGCRNKVVRNMAYAPPFPPGYCITCDGEKEKSLGIRQAWHDAQNERKKGNAYKKADPHPTSADSRDIMIQDPRQVEADESGQMIVNRITADELSELLTLGGSTGSSRESIEMKHSVLHFLQVCIFAKLIYNI